MDSLKEIKSFYKQLLNGYRVSSETVHEFVVDEEKYQAAIADVRSRLKVKLSSGFCSDTLVQQIARHYCGIGERFGDKIEFYHGSTILDAIECIENCTVKVEEFKKSRLISGLYKAHHSALSQAYSISRNILNGLNEKVVESAQHRAGNSLPGLLNTIHSDVISEKKNSGRLTGEWIIVAKVGNVKYYLCLATHDEGKGEAEIIYDRITASFEQFPVLVLYKKVTN